jgi:carboxymethylenebutenolidase
MGEHITLPTGTSAYRVAPSGSATRGLVLWPDIFGLRPLFEEHAERLAAEHAWSVCVVEPFPGDEDLALEERHGRARGFRDAEKLADAVAAADACGVEPVGLLGFCMGGMYAMKSLAAPGRFDRAVAFYGMVRVPEAWAGGSQGDALEAVLQRGDARLLCIFGSDDPWCPDEHQDEVEAAGAEVVRYPGAGHGWAHDPDRDNFRPEDAADAWSRAVSFLAV